MAVLSFSDAPRNLAQSAMVVVNNNGGSERANEAMADVLSVELLETQGKQIVGEKIWTNYIEPLL